MAIRSVESGSISNASQRMPFRRLVRLLPSPASRAKICTDTQLADTSSASLSKKPAKKKLKQDSTVSIRSNSLAQAKAETDSVICEVMVQGLPDGPEQTPAAHSYIQITDADGEKRTTDVQCLFCGTKID